MNYLIYNNFPNLREKYLISDLYLELKETIEDYSIQPNENLDWESFKSVFDNLGWISHGEIHGYEEYNPKNYEKYIDYNTFTGVYLFEKGYDDWMGPGWTFVAKNNNNEYIYFDAWHNDWGWESKSYMYFNVHSDPKYFWNFCLTYEIRDRITELQ